MFMFFYMGVSYELKLPKFYRTWINNLSIAGESKASAVYYITFCVLELFITDLP